LIESIHFGSRSGQNLVCIGGVILVEGLFAFDADTGELLWQKQLEMVFSLRFSIRRPRRGL
jgi:hypothetical protein